MAKVAIDTSLFVFMTVWITVYGQECMHQPCKCCVVPNTRCENNKGSNDYCLDGCRDGMWGHRCSNPCPINCATCYQDSNDRGYPCTSCKAGTYGSWSCDKNCPNDCATCVRTFDSRYGYPCTKCTDNTKYGEYCTTSCSAGCDGGICNIDGSCTCKAGYYGNTCDIIDCPNNCQTCTKSSPSKCQTCVDGYYNGYKYDYNSQHTYICKHPCRQHCQVCTGYNSCTTCEDGYYGEYCEYECSSGCQSGICLKENGNCNCKPGFKGENCDQCIAGKYSDDCSRICLSQNCMNNVCVRYSGRCSSCKTGYYGKRLCNTQCSLSCRYNTCEFTSGTCASGCNTGYSGDKCCLNNDRCIKCSSPSACLQCIGGYKGDLCDCPVNCLCIATGKCGSCDGNFSNTNMNCTECALHKYGEFCQSSCNNNCLDNDNNTKCHVTNGTCLTGCVNGFYGDKCDSPCNENCVKGTCSRPDGLCSYGCKHGSTQSGAECVIAAVSSDADDGGTFGAVIGGSVFVVVVMLAIIAGVLVFVFLRRRSKDNVNIAHTYENTGHEGNNSDNDHTPNEEAVLAEVDEGYEIPISNPGRSSAPKVETSNEYEELDEEPHNMQRSGSADHDWNNVVIETGDVNTYEPLSRLEMNTDTYSTLNTYELLSRSEMNADMYSRLEQRTDENTTI